LYCNHTFPIDLELNGIPLVPNQSENCNCNPSFVWFNKPQKLIFLCFIIIQFTPKNDTINLHICKDILTMIASAILLKVIVEMYQFREFQIQSCAVQFYNKSNLFMCVNAQFQIRWNTIVGTICFCLCTGWIYVCFIIKRRKLSVRSYSFQFERELKSISLSESKYAFSWSLFPESWKWSQYPDSWNHPISWLLKMIPIS